MTRFGNSLIFEVDNKLILRVDTLNRSGIPRFYIALNF